MLNIRDIKYKTALLTPEGAQIELITTDVSRQENKGELAQKATITLAETKYGGKYISSYAKLGGYVLLYANDEEVFRGPIFDWNRVRDTKTELTLLAYDTLYQLQRSKDNRFYKAGLTGKAIAADIMNEWGIPVGNLEGPNAALGKKFYRGDMISDMILDAFENSERLNGQKYVLRSEKGKVYSTLRGGNKDVYCFEENVNLIRTSDQVSILDIVTRVDIVGRTDDDKDVSYGFVTGKTQYGRMQELYVRDSDESMADATKAAKEILEKKGNPERTIEVMAPDVPGVRKGDKIRLTSDGLTGYFYVLGVQHEHTKKTMTMEVGI